MNGDRIALIGLVFTMFVQACSGIWWASRLTTVQEAHDKWINEHQMQQSNYPVLLSRVSSLEDLTEKVMVKMDLVLDELREIK